MKKITLSFPVDVVTLSKEINDEANAEHIVKCVNSHEKLVEALKIAEWMISTNQEYRPFQKNTEYMDKIRQALKTAGEI